MEQLECATGTVAFMEASAVALKEELAAVRGERGLLEGKLEEVKAGNEVANWCLALMCWPYWPHRFQALRSCTLRRSLALLFGCATCKSKSKIDLTGQPYPSVRINRVVLLTSYVRVLS